MEELSILFCLAQQEWNFSIFFSLLSFSDSILVLNLWNPSFLLGIYMQTFSAILKNMPKISNANDYPSCAQY